MSSALHDSTMLLCQCNAALDIRARLQAVGRAASPKPFVKLRGIEDALLDLLMLSQGSEAGRGLNAASGFLVLHRCVFNFRVLAPPPPPPPSGCLTRWDSCGGRSCDWCECGLLVSSLQGVAKSVMLSACLSAQVILLLYLAC